MPNQSPRTDSSAEPSRRSTAWRSLRSGQSTAPRFASLSARLLGGLKAVPRRARLAAIPFLVAGLVACGGGHDPYYDDYYYDDPSCNRANYPAVSVRFVDAVTGQPILIGVRGSISDGRWTEEMTSPEPGYEVDGRTTVLEGAFGRTGIFSVSIATNVGERYDWTDIRVSGDYCRIYTVPLQAPVRYPDQ